MVEGRCMSMMKPNINQLYTDVAAKIYKGWIQSRSTNN
jgi:hypothetical protein